VPDRNAKCVEKPIHAEPSPLKDNTGTLAKGQMLREAIERVEVELGRRENMTTVTPTQVELSRQHLNLS
jgi:hypothetical protein